SWSFIPQHFQFKLLAGTAVGIVVIAFLAGVFLFVTLWNYRQDNARAHTVKILHLANVIGNDIAALEATHRGFLLTGENAYIDSFDRRRELIKERVDELTAWILEYPGQRKRVMKIQEIMQKWLETVAEPQINARRAKGTGLNESLGASAASLRNPQLDEAREILQSLQNQEQVVLNQRMQEQEWATQGTQIL